LPFDTYLPYRSTDGVLKSGDAQAEYHGGGQGHEDQTAKGIKDFFPIFS